MSKAAPKLDLDSTSPHSMKWMLEEGLSPQEAEVREALVNYWRHQARVTFAHLVWSRLFRPTTAASYARAHRQRLESLCRKSPEHEQVVARLSDDPSIPHEYRETLQEILLASQQDDAQHPPHDRPRRG